MSNTLAELRSAIAATMKAALPNVNVAEHGGRFGAKEVQKWATGAPAIRIACLGIPEVVLGPRMLLNASWGAFCIDTDRAGVKGPRDVRVLLLVQSAMAVCAQFGQRWNGKAVTAVEKPTAANLYAADLEDMGVALWAVQWRQAVPIETIDVTGLDNFETFFAEYALTGSTPTTPTTSQEVELEGPYG